MLDIASVLKDFTPGAAGIWTLVFMFAGWLTREWRETRKLSAADRLARREGYAAQVESLQKENRALRQELRDFRVQHDEYREFCHEENDSLRRQVMKLQDDIAGLSRQEAAKAVARSRLMPREDTPE